MSVFLAALCTIAKIWKPPQPPQVDEWLKKRCCVYTVECDSPIKRTRSCHWQNIDLEGIMLSEISQLE